MLHHCVSSQLDDSMAKQCTTSSRGATCPSLSVRPAQQLLIAGWLVCTYLIVCLQEDEDIVIEYVAAPAPDIEELVQQVVPSSSKAAGAAADADEEEEQGYGGLGLGAVPGLGLGFKKSEEPAEPAVDTEVSRAACNVDGSTADDASMRDGSIDVLLVMVQSYKPSSHRAQ